ncbi:Endo-1,4-beta-xylanase A precursor [compost metagenome]
MYPSGNADLKQLKVLVGGNELALIPTFAVETTSYRIETTADRVDIQVISSDAKAVVTLREAIHTGAETIALAQGDNKFEIIIKAENGTIKTYSLTVHRQIGKVTQPVSPGSPDCMFSDIQGHWAELQICEAADKGIVEGDSATVFRPQGLVSRVEFAAMLLRTLGISTGRETDKLSFTDSDTIPVWAQDTIRDAVKSGILEGYPDGTLRPQQTVSRSEMAAMMARAMKWDIERTQITAFADDAGIPNWAKGYIHVAFQRGLLEGREGNRFIPNGQATRAEAAVVLLRLWKTLQ